MGKKERYFVMNNFIKGRIFYVKKERFRRGSFGRRQRLVFLLFATLCTVTTSIVGDFVEYFNIILVLLLLQLLMTMLQFFAMRFSVTYK